MIEGSASCRSICVSPAMSNSMVLSPTCAFAAVIASRRVHSVVVQPASAGVPSVFVLTVKSAPAAGRLLRRRRDRLAGRELRGVAARIGRRRRDVMPGPGRRRIREGEGREATAVRGHVLATEEDLTFAVAFRRSRGPGGARGPKNSRRYAVSADSRASPTPGRVAVVRSGKFWRSLAPESLSPGSFGVTPVHRDRSRGRHSHRSSSPRIRSRTFAGVDRDPGRRRCSR